MRTREGQRLLWRKRYITLNQASSPTHTAVELRPCSSSLSFICFFYLLNDSSNDLSQPRGCLSHSHHTRHGVQLGVLSLLELSLELSSVHTARNPTHHSSHAVSRVWTQATVNYVSWLNVPRSWLHAQRGTRSVWNCQTSLSFRRLYSTLVCVAPGTPNDSINHDRSSCNHGRRILCINCAHDIF